MKKLLLLLGCLLLIGGCQNSSSTDEANSEIEIRSYREGQLVRTLQIDCREGCRQALQGEDLRPVPPGTPCTKIYGGPEEIEIEGSFVQASFNLRGGCEIRRWESLRDFLQKEGVAYRDLFPDPLA